MQIYNEYIAPITSWLHHHPNYALIFTYLIAFLESIAIIGTIIPGSLTMTAVGILAGSDVMRFDLTIVFAALGAFTGDSLSYLVGYLYSHSLSSIWPFTRYPNLLRYGQEFFNRHGGKSVLIGRFMGPIRSITPIIAGMMHMSKLQFFAANAISALGWSILYLVPGYLIGAASHQLSAESAQKLFALVIGGLIGIWLMSLILKALAVKINRWLLSHIDLLWRWSQAYPPTRYFFKKLTAQNDPNPQKVISLGLIWLIFVILTIILSVHAMQHTGLFHIDKPVGLFLQSLRTPYLDAIFISLSLLLHSFAVFYFFITSLILIAIAQDWRFLRYWLSLGLLSAIIAILSIKIIPTQSFQLFGETSATFPEFPLCILTALWSFLIPYLLSHKPTFWSYALSYLLLILLFLFGLSVLFLGDNALTSILFAYCLGFCVGLAHWIFYRRCLMALPRLDMIIVLSLIVFALPAFDLYHHHYKTQVHNHTPKPVQYTLNQDRWWYQDEPILPVYSTNRIGKKIGVFNVQYAGSILELEKKLVHFGWTKQPKSFIYSIIIRAEGRQMTDNFPLMEQLYLNNNPALTMTYRTVKDDNVYILRLWRSNYHLMHYEDPIWIGNIILARKKSAEPMVAKGKHADKSILFKHILPAVHDYQILRIPIKDQSNDSAYDIPAELLIIKN